MRKLNGGLIVFVFVTLLSIATASLVEKAEASDSGNSNWINTSALSLQKTADVSADSIPSSVFGAGNVDCAVIYQSRCSIDAPYGAVGDSSLWVDSKWRPIQDFGGNSANFFAIPNSDTAFTTSSSPVYGGSYIYFTDNVSTALSPKYAAGSSDLGAILNYFQLNRNYDRRLADKTAARLPVDINSIGFSGDSQWMVATDPAIGELRVDVSNGNVLPFGPKFTYGSGLNPLPINAISSDGRYAVVAAHDSTAFKIYDLSTCETVPDRIIAPVNCLSRDLLQTGFIQQMIPGYTGIQFLRFLNDDTISFYAGYKDGPAVKLARYNLSANPSPVSKLQYLALGDSYISGEGAFSYEAGTDTDTNHCHTSLLSYPLLLGRDLDYDSYQTVACSGAVTDDITDLAIPNSNVKEPQASGKGDSSFDQEIYDNFEPGYRAQLEFAAKYQPAAITISIGGNDMGFSKILIRCLEADTCYSSYEDRIEVIRQINDIVFPRLKNTYQQLKSASPNTRVYVVGYPQIIKPDGLCGENVHLSSQEEGFAQGLIDYLDQVIQAAADNVGVRYVDVQHALDGHRLCEGQPGSMAVNGITAGDDRIFHTIGAESYHPTAYGHALLEQAILNATGRFTQTMPAPNPSATFPSEDGLAILDAPHTSRLINALNYNDNMSDDVVYRGGVWNVIVKGFKYGVLKPLSVVKAQLHSDAIELGDFTTDANGDLNAQITATSDAPTGFHTLHIYGFDIANQPVDIYKVIYVAADSDSLTPTADNPCVVIPASGHDVDQDGIDDACDGDIGPAPAGPQADSSVGQTFNSHTDNTEQKPATVANQTDITNPLAVAGDEIALTSDNAGAGQNNSGGKVLGASTNTEPAAQSAEASENQPLYLMATLLALAVSSTVLAIRRWL